MTSSATTFSAADSALGYLYQFRVGLLWALRRLKIQTDFLVSLETLDDVVFETSEGTPQELVQTKHHQGRVAALTDASVDLWKTLRIWFEGAEAGSIPIGTSLQLLTTATASPDSAPARLRAFTRDVDAALLALTQVAQTSQNDTNKAAYTAFLAADSTKRRDLLNAVVVIDSAPSVTDLDAELTAEVFWAVPRKHQDHFKNALEGWWIRRALKQLGNTTDRVLAAELEAQMAELREQYKQDALPIDNDLVNIELDDATRAGHENSTFVHQLHLAKVNKRRIAMAIRDYYRAYEQRSRWLRADLILVGDLSTYERRLAEEWERIFERMKDEIGAEASEAVREKAARDVLQWAETAVIPIRPAVTETFVTRGSLHMLADSSKIGWHPDFRDRLAALLLAQTSNA